MSSELTNATDADQRAPHEIVTEFHAAFARGDMDFACSKIHPDCPIDEAADMPWAGMYTGPSGFAAVVGKMFEYVEAGDVTRSRFETLTTGTVGNVVGKIDVRFVSRVSGRVLETKLLEVYQVVDGLIESFDIYYKNPPAVRDFVLYG